MRQLLVGLVVVFAVSATAQDMPKPGAEHAWLKERVGTWDVTMDFGGQKSTGTNVYSMELGGFWLTGTLDCEMFGQKFTGKSSEGYDPVTKKYSNVWRDSMSPGVVVLFGMYDKDKKIMTMTGEGPGMDGKPAKYKSVTEYTDKDTEKMTMYIGDAKEPAFTVTYKRRK